VWSLLAARLTAGADWTLLGARGFGRSACVNSVFEKVSMSGFAVETGRIGYCSEVASAYAAPAAIKKEVACGLEVGPT
jgi:hypothetical protein